MDVNKEKILEIGVVITDSDLNKVQIGPNIIVSCDEETLLNMDQWNQDHHGRSGLIDRVRNSIISIGSAEEIIVAFL